MPPDDAPQEFDRIARVYDTTRDPLDPGTLERTGEVLRGHGVRSILEVGVGTGRVAIPLGDLHFEVTGADSSREMLAQAWRKGFRRAVRGDAYHLPFRDACVDVSLLVHVLHILDEPKGALQEACRVARGGAWAFVRPPVGDGKVPPRSREAWGKVYRVLRAEGFAVPERGGGGPPVRERAILAEIPPDEVTLVSDQMVTETYASQLEMLAQGASRHTLHIPKEALQRAVAVVREEMGDRTFTYRKVEALAHWSTSCFSP